MEGTLEALVEDEDSEEDGDWVEGGVEVFSGSDSDEDSDDSDDSDIEVKRYVAALALSPTLGVREGHDHEDALEGEEVKICLSPEEAFNMAEEAREIGERNFIRKYAVNKAIPLATLISIFGFDLPPHIAHMSEERLMPLLILSLRRHLRRRPKLGHVNTLDDVLNLLRSSKRILILTGAGVSVSCGIPDFRSPDGIYSRLSEFDLDDPQQMFDLSYFKLTPNIFYSFAKEIYPSNFKPSPSHAFVKLLEDRGQLLRNYTQNIDTLEQATGIQNVLQCHGSFATATCIRCGYHVRGDAISEDIFAQRVPVCPVCTARVEEKRKQIVLATTGKDTYVPGKDGDEDEEEEEEEIGIMKPDIVFFGEPLPDAFDQALIEDREKVDLLIVMGSSLKVAPVSEIMGQLPHSIPQILINRTPITHMEFDIQLLGESDTIVADLCQRLGWDLQHPSVPSAPRAPIDPIPYGSHTYLYPGAIFEDEADSSDGDDNEKDEVDAGTSALLGDSPSAPLDASITGEDESLDVDGTSSFQSTGTPVVVETSGEVQEDLYPGQN